MPVVVLLFIIFIGVIGLICWRLMGPVSKAVKTVDISLDIISQGLDELNKELETINKDLKKQREERETISTKSLSAQIREEILKEARTQKHDS